MQIYFFIILNQEGWNFVLHQAMWFDPKSYVKEFRCKKWLTLEWQQSSASTCGLATIVQINKSTVQYAHATTWLVTQYFLKYSCH